MKTKEQIEKEIGYGKVYTLEEFCHEVDEGCIIDYDGVGYFHDGENITNVSVWDDSIDPKYVWSHYPYVIWYNR